MKKTKQKVKRKIPFKNAKIKGAKARQLNIQKKASGDNVDEPVLDKFIDEDTKVDDAFVAQPAEWDVRDELEQMDGFKDYIGESRGNSLTYGDY
jgi:hypothetical protein